MNLALLASLDSLPHGHSHGSHGGDDAHADPELTDARAMFFAGASIVVKEYLYRISTPRSFSDLYVGGKVELELTRNPAGRARSS